MCHQRIVFSEYLGLLMLFLNYKRFGKVFRSIFKIARKAIQKYFPLLPQQSTKALDGENTKDWGV